MSRQQQKQPRGTLAALMQRARLASKMSPVELALKSGVSVASIYAIERGATAKPSSSTLARLVAALELDPGAVAKVGGYEAGELDGGRQ